MSGPLFFHFGIGSVRVCNLNGLCKIVNKVRTLPMLVRHGLLALPSWDLIPVATVPSPQISELPVGSAFIP